MKSIRDAMPVHASGMGIWEGEYIYMEPDGRIVDRHRSRLSHQLPEEEPLLYLQRNEYEWDDGRTERFDYRFVFDGEKLKYDHPRAIGYCWEEKPLVGDLGCVRVSWQRTDRLGYGDYDMTNCFVHELIQVDRTATKRARVWQWYSDGELFLRTIIKEHRVAPAEAVDLR